MASKHSRKPVEPVPVHFRFSLAILAPLLAAWALLVLWIYVPQRALPGGYLLAVLDRFTAMGFFHRYLLTVIKSAAVALWIGWVSFEIGNWGLDRLLGRDALRPLERLALGTALGCGALAFLTLALGAARLWYPGVFVGLLALLSLALAFQRHTLTFKSEESAQPVPARVFWIAALSVFFLLLLLGDSSPEVFYDALYYHIAVPNLYQLAHRIYSVPTLLFSNFVLTLQMYFGLGMTVGGVLSAKMLHGLLTVMLAITYFAFGQRFFSRAAGWLAALFYLSMPLVGMNAVTTGTDVAWSALQVAAAYALTVALQDGNKRWLVAAALLTGISASCKYPGFPYVPIASALVLWTFRKDLQRSWRESLSMALLFAVVAGLVIVPYLIRNIVFHGNPLYPFMGTHFGTPRIDPHYWDIFVGDANTRRLVSEFKSASAFFHFIAHPWFITFSGQGNGDYVGPLYLILVPFLFIYRSPNLAFRILRRYAGLLWLLWMASSTTPRYGLPALAIAAILFADMVIRGLSGSKWRAPILILVSVGVVMNLTSFLWIIFIQDGWRVVGGLMSEKEYLANTHSAYPTPPYAGFEWMNTNLPAGSKILIAGEARSYYSKHPVIPSSVPDPQPIVQWAQESADAAALSRRLRAEGVTHIFLNFAEAVRTESYGLFPWDAHSWAVFSDFWKRDVGLAWQDQKMERENPRSQFVFALLNEEDAARPHPEPPNPFERWAPKLK